MGEQLDSFTPAYRRQIEQQLAKKRTGPLSPLAPVIVSSSSRPHENHSDHSRLGSSQSELRTPSPLEGDSSTEVRGVGPTVPSHRVRIVMHRLRLLDTDNKWAAPKALLDGLVAAGFVPGDQEGQIDLVVEQVQVHARAEIKTVIEIDELAAS